MNKQKILNGVDTHLLVLWRNNALAGNGTYTHFDYKNARTITFPIEYIVNELATRDDMPKKPARVKAKR